MVMATHDLRLASKIAQEVVFLEAGAIVETGAGQRGIRQPAPRAHQALHRNDHAPAAEKAARDSAASPPGAETKNPANGRVFS